MRNNTAVCSAQKTGGLFDVLGIDKLETSADKNELVPDIWEGIDLSTCTTAGTSGIIFDENSLDQFMDLSKFLTQDSTEFGQVLAADLTEESSLCIEPSKPSSKRKRTSSVADDHDYVFKKVRVAMPEEEAESEEDEAVAGPSRTLVVKYKERRIKNNIASRRSRETRKQKFVDMELEADKLELENQRLEEKITEMERLAKEMKAVIVKRLVDKK